MKIDDNVPNLDLSNIISNLNIGLNYQYREAVINFFDSCEDEALEKDLNVVLRFARLMVAYSEKVRLKRCFSIFKDKIQNYDGSNKNALLMSYYRIKGLASYNNMAEMNANFSKALTYLDKPYTGVEHSGHWTFGSPSVLLMFHSESGNLKEEMKQMKEGLAIYCELTDGHGYGADHVFEAEAAFYAGNFSEAEAIVHKAWYQARERDQWSVLLTISFLKMRLSFIKGNWYEVLNEQQKIAEIINTRNLLMLQHSLDICMSYINLLLNIPEKVTSWITEGDASNARIMFPAKPAYNITYGHYLLARGEYAKLVSDAEMARDTASKFPNTLGIIYADIYSAAAHHALSDNKASEFMESALDIALPDNIYMPFVENIEFINDILALLAKQERYEQGIARIMELAHKFIEAKNKITREYFIGYLDGLTEREMDVVRLVALGLSNKEIAEKLYLSEPGVKWRLHSIYEKMRVHDKKELKELLAEKVG